MSMTIYTDNSISLDGQPTGWKVAQTKEGTVVWRGIWERENFEVLSMPSARYSLSHDNPRPLHATPELAQKYPAPKGRKAFESDLRLALQK